MATVAAPEQAALGLFKVEDDEPSRCRDLVSYIAQRLGARRPMQVTPVLAKLPLDKGVAGALTTST